MPRCRNAMMQMSAWVWHDENACLGVCYDANAPCRYVMMRMSPWCMLWCECPLGSMLWCKCLHGSMPWCKCPLGVCHGANAPLLVCNDANLYMWVCHDANVSLEVCYGANAPLLVCNDVNVYMGVCHDASVLLWVWHKCFDVNTIYSKILFIFKMGLPWCLKNIFKTSFIILEKSSSFWLEAPKNWWSMLEISEWGIDLEFDDLAQKIYLHNLVKQKGVARFQSPFWKNEFFENQAS